MLPPEPLDASAFAADPVTQFAAWFAEARAGGEAEPEAAALATVGAAGAPSLRMVLVRGFDARGFNFYTNYESRKGRELAMCPLAALTFYWRSASRQIRIEGTVERVSAAESDAYFATRARESRLSAIASPQSRPIADRAELVARIARAAAAHPGPETPRPAWWGGFRLVPERIEFWQQGPHRLHDRLVYGRYGDDWRLERLAP
jgi:pyridoxamine 5'-phosphate oxidase